MKVMLTGGRGMLGRTLCAELTGFEVIPTDLPEADITDGGAFDALLEEIAPDAVIHCAAMTAVDDCESKIDLAYKLNALGSANVAIACHRHGVRLIAISTDYVFEGSSQVPYNEFDAATGGNTVYGKSKFAGETAVRQHCPDHVICRISWLYGPGGPSFVHTMKKLAMKL
jgi:dTDP-4-dehydrorhamnose reductase